MRRSLIALILASFLATSVPSCSSVPGPSRTDSAGALIPALLLGAVVVAIAYSD